MITQEPTSKVLSEWKTTWLQYKDKLRPNRKSGTELLYYLQSKYLLTEIHEKSAMDAVVKSVTMNVPFSEKLPQGAIPVPRTFFVENAGNGIILYQDENKDSAAIWGGNISRIFVGVEVVTGFFMVEGSTMLWDEIYAFRGLDEKDLQNYVCVAEYISCLKRFGLLSKLPSTAE